jgi:Icc-related predicted phosphoesterase
MSIVMNLTERIDELIVVGDLTAEHTVELTNATSAHLRVVEQQDSEEEAALACGFAAAEGEIVVTLDAHSDVSKLDGFISALEDGADFVGDSDTLPQDATTSFA